MVVIVMTSRLVFPGGVMIVPANAGWRAIPPDDCPCTFRVHGSAQNVDVSTWPDDSPCTRRLANLPMHIPGARVRPESRCGHCSSLRVPVLECELAFGLGLPEVIVELVLGLVSLSMGSKEYLNMGNLRCGRSGGHLQTYVKHFPQENCSWGVASNTCEVISRHQNMRHHG